MNERYHLFPFRGRTGYLLGGAGSEQLPVAIGHTASVPPWKDPGVHLHQASTEIYLLLEGKLDLLLGGEQVSLRPWEMLVVHPLVPHAILGGAGAIEHRGIRTPDTNDKQMVEPPGAAPSAEDLAQERELRRPWGFRIPLQAPQNQNSWLLGGGISKAKGGTSACLMLTLSLLDKIRWPGAAVSVCKISSFSQ